MPLSKRTVFLTAIASGTMLNPLNSSMISLALHSIQKDFHLSFSTVSWLISSFYLASAVAQPVTGKIGDMIGRKKMFLAGLLLVAVSAIGAPLAPAFFVLLLMRLFQSIGSSAIYPSGVALIRTHIHENQASALAVLSIFASAMTALGPTAGGIIIGIGGWPSIFLVNFPFIVISFLLGWFIFPKDPENRHASFKDVVHELDWTGIFLFAAGLVLLLYFLLELESAVHIWTGVAGIVLLVLFVIYEARTGRPFIDVRFLSKHRSLSVVYLQFIVLNLFNYCLFFGLPSFYQDGLHFSVHTSGFMMLFMSGASILISLVSGKWIDRAGTAGPIRISALTMIAGAVFMAVFFIHASVWLMGVILFILGIGYGIGNVALQAAMLNESPEAMVGTSSGLFQTCRYLGSILSSVVLGVVFASGMSTARFLILSAVLVAVSAFFFLLSLKTARARAV
ncbi:MFS transporter [Heyndrickxia faecalis]|uniref:MFS transporter n=1 Tax=Heyndrickxia faecalis TaxID=2824910 RepID=UPI001B3A30EE|nr:MFS transporter [Heyndrickxia faecalis]MBQ4910762.1 MFS transporter [Heyndrickxia faecalis]